MMLVYENILVEHTQFYWFLSGLIILFVINLLPIFICKYKDNIFLCTIKSYSIIFFTIQQIKEQFMALFYILMEVLYDRQYSWFHYSTISLPYQIWKKAGRLCIFSYRRNSISFYYFFSWKLRCIRSYHNPFLPGIRSLRI